MSKFWESLGEKIADRWLQVSIPALVFWLGGFLSWLTRPGELTVLRDRGKQLADQPASTQALIIVGALMLVAASGVAVQVLTVPVQRLIEGYWPWPLRGLSRRLTDRARAKAARIEARLQVLAGSVFAETASNDQREEFTTLDRKRRRIPYRPSAIMPTRVGNTLRAADLNSLAKYGLDPQILWPHLRQLLPEQARQDFEDAQRALSLNISVIIWAIGFTLFGVLNWWPVPVGLALSVGAFLFTPRRAENVADLAEVTWDLYRFDLYRRLRWPLPANPQEEQMAGVKLTTYLVRGSRSPEPSFTEVP